MTPIENLIGYMTIRKSDLEQQLNAGQLPGIQDSYDIERIIGQIKELEHIMEEAWKLR